VEIVTITDQIQITQITTPVAILTDLIQITLITIPAAILTDQIIIAVILTPVTAIRVHLTAAATDRVITAVILTPVQALQETVHLLPIVVATDQAIIAEAAQVHIHPEVVHRAAATAEVDQVQEAVQDLEAVLPIQADHLQDHQDLAVADKIMERGSGYYPRSLLFQSQTVYLHID
jgi:hypothetical protein